MRKFKVGDRVRCLNPNGAERLVKVGDVGTIIATGSLNWVDFKALQNWVGGDDKLELVTNEGENMDTVQKLKQLALSPQDRLLRKHGVVNDCGEVTADGKTVLWSLILEQYKDDLVAQLQQVEDEDKAEKAARKK